MLLHPPSLKFKQEKMLNTVLILGSFRIMIGSIGGLSHLTKVSGISEVLGTVYVPNARKNALRKSCAKLQVACYNFEIKSTGYLTINEFESYMSDLEFKKS